MLLTLLLVYLILVNAAGWLFMLTDKLQAVKHRLRIPEATLMTVAALGGSIGSLIGMYTFHHKTRKPKFYVGIPLILTAQVLLGILLYVLCA